MFFTWHQPPCEVKWFTDGAEYNTNQELLILVVEFNYGFHYLVYQVPICNHSHETVAKQRAPGKGKQGDRSSYCLGQSLHKSLVLFLDTQTAYNIEKAYVQIYI